MPAGVDRGALFGFLVDQAGEDVARTWFAWLTDSLPSWGREGWTRLDAARAECLRGAVAP